MEQFLKQLVLWTYMHPNWAVLVVFLISVSEAIAIVGTFIPGTIVMTAIGALIGAGILPICVTTLFAALGAFFGDSMSFIVGYVLKGNIRKVWPFSRRQHWLDRGQHFFQRHGKKSIFIARFIGPIRAFVPITAGALHMKPLQFFSTDLISAILWAIVYMLPGMLIGAFSLDLPPDLALHFIWWFALALVAAIIVTWILRIVSLHIADVIDSSLNSLWQTMCGQPKFSGLCHLLKHHNANHPRGQLGVFLSLLILIGIFLTIAIHVFHYGPLHPYNLTSYHLFRSLRNLPTDRVLLALTFFGDKHVLALPIVTVFFWLCYKRCWRAVSHWGFLALLTYGSVAVLKPIIGSTRPEGLAVALSHFSFPSGHSTLSISIYGFVCYLVATRWPPRVRWKCYLSAFCSCIPIFISRLYLGAHWVTDIIGSIIWGLICVLLVILSYQRKPAERVSPFGLLIVFCASLAVAWGTYFHLNFEKQMANYQPVWTKHTVSLSSWWNGDGKSYPFVQVDRFGQPVQVLNIQWAGDIETITQSLAKDGWVKPLPQSWVTAIQHPDLSHKYAVHLKTALFKDRKPVITLIKPITNGKSLLLRLWQTDIQFENSPLLLWAGVMSIHYDHGTPKPSHINQNRINHMLISALTTSLPNYDVKTKPIRGKRSFFSTSVTHSELILLQPISKEDKQEIPSDDHDS